MKKKWVLQLCHGYSAPFDDVARQWRTLFDATEYRVLTVFLTGEHDQRVVDVVGGDVHFLGFKSKDLRGLKLRQIRAIRDLHETYNFCCAVAHRYKSIYIATHLPEISVIGVSHAYGVYDRFWRKRYVMKRADRLMLAGVSDAIRDDARSALPGFPLEQIQTVYNHIDLECVRGSQFSRNEARERLGLHREDFVVGNVGRLHPDKDQKTLIKAFARVRMDMPDARLIILGEGRLRPALEKLICDLGLVGCVELRGRVQEAFRYFGAFDVFVLSSDYEPFGMVLLEAMAVPIPVISSECGGAPEVLGDGGLFFPVGDVDALASQLQSVFRSKKQNREEIAAKLYGRLQARFCDEAVRQAFAELCRTWCSCSGIFRHIEN